MTEVDAGTVLGDGRLARSRQVDLGRSITCTYRPAVGASGSQVAVTLVTRPLSKREFRALTHVLPPGARVEPVSSVGDVAYWEVEAGQPGGVLSVLDGSVAVVIQVGAARSGRAEPLETAKELARRALDGIRRPEPG
jgi:hypothetical protein